MSGSSQVDFASGIGKTVRGPDLAPLDPTRQRSADTTHMRASIFDTDRYEHNPRGIRSNPNREEIKASIRERGLDHPIAVTQRPGSERLLLRAGAGTRWELLHELVEETGDYERFAYYDAVLYPWRGELDVLAAHGVENNVRGPLTFLENALHEARMREMIVADDPAFESASVRDRAGRYAALGVPINYTLLGYYDYVNSRLYGLIPEALREGLGRPRVIDIRRLEKAGAKAVELQDASAVDAYWRAFDDALRESDGADFEIHEFQDRLFSHVRRVTGIDLTPRAATASRGLDVDDREDANVSESSPPGAVDSVNGRTGSANAGAAERIRGKPASAGTAAPGSANAEKGGEQEVPSSPPSNDHPGERLAALRGEAQDIAQSLAAEHGLQARAFFLTNESGIGYMMDNPDGLELDGSDSAADTLVVHRELAAIAWAVMHAEVRAGEVDPSAFDHYEHQQQSPKSFERSDAYRNVRPDALHWRFADLRLRAAAGTACGVAAEYEQGVVNRIDALWNVAIRYVRTLNS